MVCTNVFHGVRVEFCKHLWGENLKMPTCAWCAVTGSRSQISSRCDGACAWCHSAEWWRCSERRAAVNMRRISLWSISSRWQWWTAGIAAKLERQTIRCSQYPLTAFALKVKVSRWNKNKSTSFSGVFFSLWSYLHALFETLVVHSHPRLMSDDWPWGVFNSSDFFQRRRSSGRVS